MEFYAIKLIIYKTDNIKNFQATGKLVYNVLSMLIFQLSVISYMAGMDDRKWILVIYSVNNLWEYLFLTLLNVNSIACCL